MSRIFRFLGEADEAQQVLSWFAGLPESPQLIPSARATLVYFPELGPVFEGADGEVDLSKAAIVSVFAPQRRRGVLLTAGEVHFLATPLRKRFQSLHRISQRFAEWLSQFPLVYSHDSAEDNRWNYYLEGSLKNFDSPIRAFPKGMAALRAGQYFVADEDTPFVLDKLCKALRLRGVECSDA